MTSQSIKTTEILKKIEEYKTLKELGKTLKPKSNHASMTNLVDEEIVDDDAE